MVFDDKDHLVLRQKGLVVSSAETMRNKMREALK